MSDDRKKIVLVDDMAVNLMVGRNALSESYDVFTVTSGEKLLKLIPLVNPDLILLDIEMPEMNGFMVMKILKDNPETENIPVIFLTARNDTVSELKGLSLGAVDYISKPFTPTLLLKRIEQHLLVEDQKKELKHYNDNLSEMVKQKTKTIFELQSVILGTMAELVEYRDDVTGGHIERTQKYMRILIDKLRESGLYRDITCTWDTDLVMQSVLLHDLGKIAINDRILRKTSKLTPEEFVIMKKHTTFGRKVIEKIKQRTSEHEFLDYAEVLAVHHHERWDGKGYPDGLEGENIPLLARLMAIVDVYDALISIRPYKKAYSHDEAVKTISDGRGTQFDPSLVDLFISVADDFDSAQKTVNYSFVEEFEAMK